MRPRSRAHSPGRPGGPPPVPHVQVASPDLCLPPPAFIARCIACADSDVSPDRLPGTGSASMPTLWIVNLRKPFGCASPYRAVSRR